MLRALTSEEVETSTRHPFAYSCTLLTLSSPSPPLLGSITHQQQQQELPTHTREERLLSPLCRHWSWSRPYLMGEGERAALALASNDVFLITMIAIRGWQRQ